MTNSSLILNLHILKIIQYDGQRQATKGKPSFAQWNWRIEEQTTERFRRPVKAHSMIEYMSSQHDSFIRFKVEAERQIQELISRVDEISILCDHIYRKSVEASEAYSYQFNIKIVGVVTVTERETSQQTADLCLMLFAALGVELVSVSLKDIDTAHRVPSRVASNRPNAIICKFRA